MKSEMQVLRFYVVGQFTNLAILLWCLHIILSSGGASIKIGGGAQKGERIFYRGQDPQKVIISFVTFAFFKCFFFWVNLIVVD